MDEATARRLLDRERQRLLEIRGGQTGDAGTDRMPSTEVNPFGSDVGTELFDRQVDQSIAGHVEEELAEVEAAFDRLERGEYGRCEVCGRQISDERLEVVPATRFCRDHRAQEERRMPERAAPDPTATSDSASNKRRAPR